MPATETPAATVAAAPVRPVAPAAAAPPSRLRTPIRQRLHKGGQSGDKFHVDPAIIPDGMSWEWKRQSVLGQPDYGYEVMQAEQGWEPVQAERFPKFMPPGYSGAIIRDGMMLMERPQELTDEARAEDLSNAREQVSVQVKRAQQNIPGQLPREEGIVKNKANVMKREFEAVPISEME